MELQERTFTMSRTKLPAHLYLKSQKSKAESGPQSSTGTTMILLRKANAMDSKNIPKILQQRNCYPENLTGSEEPGPDLIHFIPWILLSHIPKRGVHQLRPHFNGAGKSERNFRAALLPTCSSTWASLTRGPTGTYWGSLSPDARGCTWVRAIPHKSTDWG